MMLYAPQIGLCLFLLSGMSSDTISCDLLHRDKIWLKLLLNTVTIFHCINTPLPIKCPKPSTQLSYDLNKR